MLRRWWRIDGGRVREGWRAFWGLFPIAAVSTHHLDSIVEEGAHRAAVLADGGFDNAVVECEGAGVVCDRDGGVRIVAESSRRILGCEHKRRQHDQGDETNRKRRRRADESQSVHFKPQRIDRRFLFPTQTNYLRSFRRCDSIAPDCVRSFQFHGEPRWIRLLRNVCYASFGDG